MADPGRHHVAMLVRNRYTNDTRVEKEARTLVGAGHRVTIVADAAPGLPTHEIRDGSEVHRVARRGPRVPGLRFVIHEWRLARRLRALRPTVLHAHDTNALVPVALAARRLGIPFVYDAHDLWLGRPRRERGRLYFRLSQLYYGVVERLPGPAGSRHAHRQPADRRAPATPLSAAGRPPRPELSGGRHTARAPRAPRPAGRRTRSTRRCRSCSTSAG